MVHFFPLQLTRLLLVSFVPIALGLGCGSRAGEPAPAEDTESPPPQQDAFQPPNSETQTSSCTATMAITEIQNHPKSISCDESSIQNILGPVTICDAVVTSNTWEAYTPSDDSTTPALDGVFISTAAGGPNNGIQLIVPRPLGVSLQPGDQISLEGEYLEFYCMSQLKALSLTKTGTTDVLSPALTTAGEIVAEPEPWEGSLVQIQNVEVIALHDFGQYEVTGGLLVGGRFKPDYFANVGDQLNSITGIIEYSYSTYKLQPRSPADLDIGELGPPPVATTATIEEVQQHESSANCTQDSSPQPSTQANRVLQGIVVSPVQTISANLSSVYLSNESTGAWSGVQLLYPKSLGLTPSPGDHLEAQGNVQEYYCMTQLTAESVTALGTLPVPEAFALDPSAVDESYEGTLLKFESVTVESELNQYGEFEINGGLLVSLSDFGVSHEPSIGTQLQSISGVLKYSFGRYKLAPLSQDDITP
jgi:predicted extracellular nuclease